MSRSKLPTYRRQKGLRGDRAFVRLGDRRVYLGDYGSPESYELYERTVQEWLANGKQPPVDPAGLRVVELAARFWTFAKDFYRHPDGTPTSSLENYRTALRPLKRLYGSMLVSEFGPLCLKAMRTGWVQQGLSRKTVNELWSLVSFLEPQNQMMRRFSIIYVLPSMLTGSAAYGLLSLWRSPSQSDGELHCRRCDHILRGLSEPRCPECGEAI